MDEVEVVAVHTRQQPGAGPSGQGQATLAGKQQLGRQRRRAPAPAQRQSGGGVIDLTDDRDDDDVVITLTKSVKRPRLAPRPGAPGAGPTGAAAPAAGGAAATLAAFQMAAAAGPAAAAVAAVAAAAPPAAPPSPKGYKCIICLDRMEADLATTTCGHMFCFKCITEWVKKSGNCPQCRSKLTKTKIIRLYLPPS
ncbi:hypothetical protein HXX76_001257 [Chlamydomonas incerta]|uniref:RING-type domain-containing protein n=1 Tax=Chlamydomonas incerta TaxID=51695 RepID=A0A835WBS2_CHLIN|nr:hypothetical protein HXX76_001257 [Chlamydomonas incerta]|eukprot:KAG2444509.1 hypothetical protein HXX76_001257 [Chlamydomonas incerta]